MKKKTNVLVTWRLMIKFLTENKKKYFSPKIKFHFLLKKQGLTESELVKIIEKFDAIICGDDEFTKKVIDKAKNLKVISKWGTGLDSINVDYAKKNGIKVFNTPNAFTKGVAQLALSFILNLSRHTLETHENVKKGNWSKISGFLIKDKVVGIIGFGNIGREISRLVLRLNMKVIFNDIKKIKNVDNKNIQKVSLQQLFRKSDIVISCCDLNKTSLNLINNNMMKKMKQNSGIINISRGSIVNENDLIKNLQKKKIRFAALDVFEKEPINKNSKLLKFNNCILSTHNAFNTVEEVNNVNINTLKNLNKGLKI